MKNRVTTNQTGEEYDQIICDQDHIILEDHVCLYPGYVTVEDGKYWQNYSDDPNNRFNFPASDARMAEDPNWKAWVEGGMLKNRKEYRRTENVQIAPEGISNDMHFTDIESMFEYLDKFRLTFKQTIPYEGETGNLFKVAYQWIDRDDLMRCAWCDRPYGEIKQEETPEAHIQKHVDEDVDNTDPVG